MDTLALRSPPPPLGVLREDGSLDAARGATVSEDLAVALYEHMVVARALDERVAALHREGTVPQHASAVGEEAMIVGAAAAMNDEDWIFPTSREVAAALWRGMPLSAYAYHALGTEHDAGKGRSSPDAPSWKAARVASVSPLAGTHIPHAVGLAWAARMHAADVAALVFFGEEAMRCADFHTGLNFAGVARAPVVAVCRTASSAASQQTAGRGIAIRSMGYGLACARVDGGDVVAVLGVVREARRRAAAGLGGTLVEAIVDSTLDRGSGAGSDPIARMRRQVEARGLWSDDRERHLRSEVGADVERAFASAAAAKPTLETLFDHVYADLPWHLKEQRGT
ncbi:MAG TPA: thiamine pyrophosphate-dependent enzyme [Polyangiaceae bacterium]|nr:thiamine pyrophosphate-dependent enzyme [Polyangiaceae bacterium]